jgi:hypothetical protein
MRTVMAASQRLARTSAPGLANLGNQPRRREPLDEREDTNSASKVGQHGALARVQCLGPVVATFDVNVRSHNGQESVGTLLGENDDGIDARQRGEDGGTLTLRDERSSRSLEFTDRAVSVEADDKEIAKLARALQVTDVTEMKEVEAAVRADNAATAAAC